MEKQKASGFCYTVQLCCLKACNLIDIKEKKKTIFSESTCLICGSLTQEDM